MQEYEKKNQKSKEIISLNVEDSEKTIINLKIQLEEEKIIKEAIRSHLNERRKVVRILKQKLYSKERK